MHYLRRPNTDQRMQQYFLQKQSATEWEVLAVTFVYMLL
uniref:Uncharacterized protein n=1 Tax=Anguilla anguilla TaxID=7936 RepID=A0A0E9WGU7_ANGAN